MNNVFTSSEVVALTGITPRQLQWWDERGIVAPTHEGHRRLYSLDDLAEVAVICELRSRGFSLQRVRKVMRYLQRELGKRLVETVSATSEYHLLTDGKNIFLRDSAQAVIDVLKNSRQPMLTICLSDAVERVQADIQVFAKKKQASESAPRAMAAAAGASMRAATLSHRRSDVRKGRRSRSNGNNASQR